MISNKRRRTSPSDIKYREARADAFRERKGNEFMLDRKAKILMNILNLTYQQLLDQASTDQQVATTLGLPFPNSAPSDVLTTDVPLDFQNSEEIITQEFCSTQQSLYCTLLQPAPLAFMDVVYDINPVFGPDFGPCSKQAVIIEPETLDRIDCEMDYERCASDFIYYPDRVLQPEAQSAASAIHFCEKEPISVRLSSEWHGFDSYRKPPTIYSEYPLYSPIMRDLYYDSASKRSQHHDLLNDGDQGVYLYNYRRAFMNHMFLHIDDIYPQKFFLTLRHRWLSFRRRPLLYNSDHSFEFDSQGYLSSIRFSSSQLDSPFKRKLFKQVFKTIGFLSFKYKSS